MARYLVSFEKGSELLIENKDIYFYTPPVLSAPGVGDLVGTSRRF